MSEGDETSDVVGRKWCGVRPDPAQKRWRKCYHMQMVILPFIPIVAVILQTVLSLKHILHYRLTVAEVDTQVSAFG